MSSRAVATSCMGFVSVEAPRAGQGSCSGLSMGLLVYAPRWPLLASSRPLLSALHTTASVIFNMHIRLFPETPFRCPPPVLRVQSKPFPHCLAFRTPPLQLPALLQQRALHSVAVLDCRGHPHPTTGQPHQARLSPKRKAVSTGNGSALCGSWQASRLNSTEDLLSSSPFPSTVAARGPADAFPEQQSILRRL